MTVPPAGAGYPSADQHAADLTRDFAVSVFVVWDGQVLLHPHRKLGIFLPPGGHVEPNELPNDAAVREVLEEAGITIELVGSPAVEAPGPLQLVPPRGVQLEDIGPGHQHIDLVYLARPSDGYAGHLAGEEPEMAWYGPVEANALVTPEVSAWIALAIAEVD